MRNKIIMAFVASAFSFAAYAQQQQNVAVCSDKAMHSELVSLDKSLEERGFALEQFKMMNMPSGSYVPVTVTMQEGKMYQINFIASKNFQQYHLTIMDKDRKKLVDKKIKTGGDRQLSESFAAPYTGNYLVIVSQKIKGQAEACGGLSVLKNK
ncbi:hypothetical protein [Taibaiella koreensis]|uniref:hypothetical protein n=1 Tax=Taibaiella koreensis TaxID=1268548 RepID=UPI000E599391|nr:hypothetical protein [Taibaiella koreensis]